MESSYVIPMPSVVKCMDIPLCTILLTSVKLSYNSITYEHTYQLPAVMALLSEWRKRSIIDAIICLSTCNNSPP